MKSFFAFLNRISNWKTLLIFLALDIVFSGYILKNAEDKINELAGKKIGVIDLTFGFNPQKTLMMVAEYGDAARAYYATTEMTTDIIYPIVYAFLFGIILTMIYRTTKYESVSLLPFLCLVFDYLENISIVALLQSFPEQSTTVATICEGFKLIKWIIFALIILLVVFGLIFKLLSRRKQPV